MSQGKVLLVEDEPLIAMDLQDVITEAGFEVAGPVSHVDRAVEIATKEQLSGAILDFRVRNDDTVAVADILLARGVPFIFITGLPGSLPDRFASVPQLSKPFNREALERLISSSFS